MSDITKSFYGVTVLKNVSLTVEKGEIHALIGENGAGKSTLMNILGGVHEKDSGKVVFDEEELKNLTPKIAQNMGIEFVHQELNLFNDLKVYENIFLTKEIQNKFKRLEKNKMIDACKELFEELNIHIEPTAVVSDIDTSSKQLVEIAKALHNNAKLIIMDEPTTTLNNKEIDILFGIMKSLKQKGTSFIYISHKMPEIFNICDKYTVLRNGEWVATGHVSDTHAEEITRLMVGENFQNKEYYVQNKFNEIILDVKDLTGNGFNDISFSLKKGEVIAFTGLKGSGGSEILESIFGHTKIQSGQMNMRGKEIVKTSIKKAMTSGIALVPRNRKENGIISSMSLLDNMMISKYNLSNHKQHINSQKEKKNYEAMKEVLDIKANNHLEAITFLSGGNQQKVIIARWLSTDAEIYIFDNPTQGIDVGAKAEIYKVITELARQGKSIIINTLEIPEIQKIADRCLVLYHGRIIKELQRKEISEEQVMLYATNAV